jgi:hypothetical protein
MEWTKRNSKGPCDLAVPRAAENRALRVHQVHEGSHPRPLVGGVGNCSRPARTKHWTRIGFLARNFLI